MIRIRRGLDLPITGQPRQEITEGPRVRAVALVGFDYVGMKPTMLVKVGDRVQKGQPVFTDKKTEGVQYTAPASGTVSAIHRGAKRVFQSLVIDVDAEEDEITFARHAAESLDTLDRQTVVDQLVESGLWTALRTRPFGKVPAPDSTPAGIFVTAVDTHPLAADPRVVLSAAPEAFDAGIRILTRLTDGPVFVCHGEEPVKVPPLPSVRTEGFTGPHPAGLPGTHIHCLMPVSEQRTVWYLDYQDVMAVGTLFREGRLDTTRIVALAGPSVENPRLVRSRVGADLTELTAGELIPGEHRVVSGSVFGGRAALGPVSYLGRYHRQVSVLPEGRERHFMGWLSPGLNRFSVMRIYLSRFLPGKRFAFTTNTQGSPRAIVPIGAYEKVMPLDILPTQLLRALVTGDIELAQKLGALELDEEDLALCSFVCPGKYEYGPILRGNLKRIEEEG